VAVAPLPARPPHRSVGTMTPRTRKHSSSLSWGSFSLTSLERTTTASRRGMISIQPRLDRCGAGRRATARSGARRGGARTRRNQQRYDPRGDDAQPQLAGWPKPPHHVGNDHTARCCGSTIPITPGRWWRRVLPVLGIALRWRRQSLVLDDQSVTRTLAHVRLRAVAEGLLDTVPERRLQGWAGIPCPGSSSR
jgi:hypothetical protein